MRELLLVPNNKNVLFTEYSFFFDSEYIRLCKKKAIIYYCCSKEELKKNDMILIISE